MSTYIIAEIGNTHEGSLGLAKQFIKAAAATGVDCVKFQTHIYEAESLDDAPNPPYFKDESRKEYFERTAFTLEEHKKLKEYTNSLGCDFISSPFSIEAIDMLEEVGVPFYKVASGEVSNIPLLERLGRTQKKVLLSSGMSSWEDLEQAIFTLKEYGCPDVVLLQCTSKYPCPPEYSGLNMMAYMQERFKLDTGYSDHTSGNSISIAAVVKGAKVIEKHFTLSKSMYGSDAQFASEPHEFKQLVDSIRDVDIALASTISKQDVTSELDNMKLTFEKSIVTNRALKIGEVIAFEDLAFKKPGSGIPAKEYRSLIGKVVVRNIKPNTRIEYSDYE
ncbi:N-acetylneuraminate synthase family protein [Vibrio sp. Isolate25]|uniref:N-acetylneuraminate synthase family protein n=1 Tax=Vibrio sp. Isolate25 TaxID=2908535 RepID=UPI001EFD4CB0|nr:N-acetylneuraminate synthase family protein [Vibrio sp. Isolate25]MCG9597824.1 N-acetylneuraminate synthase family protein [Vibrio sp. Isolate25]